MTVTHQERGQETRSAQLSFVPNISGPGKIKGLPEMSE